MTFAKDYKKFLILPAILSLLSLAAIFGWGLKPGIDLAGGSLMQVTYLPAATSTAQAGPGERPDIAQVQSVLDSFVEGEVRVQAAGENDFIIRMPAVVEEQKTGIEEALATLGNAEITQFTSISPTIGVDLLRKSLVALGLIVLSIIVFIAFAFRHVSLPVASWKYGIISIVALVHDILVPTGLFALLGYVAGAEVDSLFIVGLLAILGISINDTIVVFDRIRENLRRNIDAHKKEAFEVTIERSVWQTMARSINTSVTVIIVLIALYVFGPETTKYFSLTLLVGMVAGTYSSIFLASPLLIIWEKYSHTKKR